MSDFSWTDAVKPITAKCEVAANFGSELTFNRDGAAALGQLLRNMALLLDLEHAQSLLQQAKGQGGGDG